MALKGNASNARGRKLFDNVFYNMELDIDSHYSKGSKPIKGNEKGSL